jgi:hypothetical protein
MQWPDWSARLMQAFFAREPAAEDRIETAIAHLSAIYVGAHRQKGKPAPKIADFLLFRGAWDRKINQARYSPEDLKTMAALGLKVS